MGQPQAILIAGATASGKSELAIELAKAVDGVVINADSMQVYRDLSVLTARPQPDEMQGVTHELYGMLAAGDTYSVGRYVRDAEVLFKAVRGRGQVPIFVGGTGLYFRGLLEGLSPVPPIDPSVRQRWRELGQSEGASGLYTALKARDAEMASRLMPNDVQRLARALEVIESTGRSLSYWQSQPGTPIVDEAHCIKVVVTMDRGALYERCDRRFCQMLENGALYEVARLQAMQLDAQLPIMRALGVAPLMSYLNGDSDLAQARTRGQAETRQYVKRQLTWLKRNMMSWKYVNIVESERNDVLNDIFR